MMSGGLRDLGRRAAARRNPRCAGCENPLPRFTTGIQEVLIVGDGDAALPVDRSVVLLAVSADDIPDSLQCSLGLNPVMVLFLCRGCSHLVKTPKKLRSLFLKDTLTDFGTNISVSYIREGKLCGQYLEPAPLVRPAVGPLTLFQGRSASLISLCKDADGLRRYCDGTEQLGLRTVCCFSSSEDILAVYDFGLLFGQEQEPFIGQPHWHISPRLIGLNRVSYLVTDDSRSTYVGVVGFDTMGYSTLAWVWLHPSVRRRGILSRAWPHLEGMHSGFKVLLPLSNQMQGFLAKHDPTQRHELTEFTGTEKTR
jgi:hypothetical protein